MTPAPTHKSNNRRGRHAGFASLCGLLIALTGASSSHAQDPATVARDDYIVLYEPTLASVDRKVDAQERAAGFKARFRYRHAVKGFSAKLSEAQVKRLRDDSDVAFVSPDSPVYAQGSVPLAAGEPTPPTGVRRIAAASTAAAREASVASVAVIDTGIDLTHPDLNAVQGINCVTPGTPAQDDNGHGTHVAGSAAARNNGSGVVGVSPNTQVYAVKILDSAGKGSTSEAICGLDWVSANSGRLNLRVANMSFGGDNVSITRDEGCGAGNGDGFHRAVCGATAAGVTLVASAGNDSRAIGGDLLLPPLTPATYPEVLTVSAMSDSDGQGGATGPSPNCGEADDAAASFSNYATRSQDEAHMIAAPGVCIRSTLPGGDYGTKSGTSMAGPHVAGAIALCLGEGSVAGPCADKTPAQIIDYMRSEAASYSAANPSYGFAGDPLRPTARGYFGYLVRATPAPATTTPATTTPGATTPAPSTTSAPSAASPPPGSLPGTASGTVPITGARIGALLDSDLTSVVRALRRSGIAPLVRRRGFTARALGALTAGRLSATLSGSTASSAGVARRVVLATGSRSVSRLGRYAVALRLTRQGKLLLRSDRRARVTLTLSFRDAFGHAATRRKSVILRR